MTRFPSKVDGFFRVQMAVTVLVPAAAAVAVVRESAGLLAVVPALLALAAVAMTLRTHYDVTDDELIVRSGPFRWRVALSSIRRLRTTRSLRSAPALSMDRIEVQHDGGTVVVSPRDAAGFVRAVRSRTPRIELDGLSPDGTRADIGSGNRVLWAVMMLPLGILAIVGVILFVPRAAPNVTLAPASLIIEGGGREAIPLDQIESASLEETLPPLRKSSGFNSFTALEGRFVHPRLGEGHVWVRRNDPPFILARTRDGFVLLNLKDPASTRAMYAELSRRLQAR